MRHFIIVKFAEHIDWIKFIDPIKKLFETSLQIDGINHVNIYTSCIDLPNRYDLMIEMRLTKEALKKFDESEIHAKWKSDYGKYIINKTIFDCEL